MATITFENGKKVEFDGTPTPQDIEEVAKTLGVTKKKSALRKVGDFFTRGTQRFAETLGTAASTIDPVTTKMRKETLAKTNEQVDLLLQQARQEPDKDRAKRMLEAARKLANTDGIDIFNRPEYQKTAKQIIGEGLETGLEVASFGTFGAGKIPTALKVLKPGQKILQNAATGAKYGGAFGTLFGVSGALQEDKDALEVAGAGLIGGGIGGIGGGLLGGAITGSSQGMNAIISRASKLSNQGKKIIGKQAYNKLIQTSENLVKMSPTASRNEMRWNKNTPEFLANEFVIDERTLKPKSILQLIDSDGRRLENTEAINALRRKYNEESRAFNSLLKDSGEYVSLNEFKTKSIAALDDLKVRGSDYDTAVNQLNKEISAYKKNYKDNNINIDDDVLIKITDFSKIKTGLWAKTSNFNPSQSDKLLSDINYRMGQTAKDLIESTVEDTAVKRMNQRLGDFASAINVLEKAQGKVLPGGFFGRQFARLAGTVAGSPGGVGGSIIGNITGGVLADIMVNPKIKTSIWSKVVQQLGKQKGGQSIIDEAVEILSKRNKERAARKLIEAPKSIQLGPKSDSSRVLTQEEANDLLNKLKLEDRQKLLPELSKGEGETIKTISLNRNVKNFINKAYKEAPRAKKEIDEVAKQIANDLNGKVATAPLKKQEKVLFNIKNKYKGDTSRVSDIARNTIVVDNPSKAFNKLQSNKNYVSGKFVNHNTNPLGYSGYNTKLKASNGHIAEIQVNTPDMIYAKEPKSSAIKQLGEDLYNKLDKKYNGIGGKGHKFYDEWVDAWKKNNMGLIKNIESESKQYYSKFIK
jgi:uncharacterized protein YukE